MFEAIAVKQNKIVEILKIKITIPLIDWEKDNITCFSANRELIHLTIYKDTLFNNLALNDEMHDHFFKLIVTVTDISELDKCLFEEWNLPHGRLEFFSWRSCNLFEERNFKQNKSNKIFDRLHGDHDRVLRDYKAAKSCALEGLITKLDCQEGLDA